MYFTSNRVREPYYEPPHDEIYAVSAGGGEIVKVAGIAGPIHAIALSPDGGRIAFVGSLNGGDGVAQRSYSQPDLFVTAAEPGATPRNLTAGYDYDIGGGVGGDQAPPRGGGGSKPYWSADGRSIFVDSAEEGRANLKRIDADTGKVEPMTSGDHSVFFYSATPDGSKVALLISTPTNIGDLFLMDERPGHLERLTHINEELFSQSEPDRAGNDLVQELRRPQDPGLGAAAAGFRRGQEIPADPGYSRRPARRLRLHIRPRVSVDGRQRLRRAVSQSARQHQLRPGVRQCHPVRLSRRRFQGSDGGRGRSDRARLGGSGQARRDRRQRRRRPDQLDGRSYRHASRQRHRSARSRTGATSGTPPISPCSRRSGSAARRGSRRRISRRGHRSPTWTRSPRR